MSLIYRSYKEVYTIRFEPKKINSHSLNMNVLEFPFRMNNLMRNTQLNNDILDKIKRILSMDSQYILEMLKLPNKLIVEIVMYAENTMNSMNDFSIIINITMLLLLLVIYMKYNYNNSYDKNVL